MESFKKGRGASFLAFVLLCVMTASVAPAQVDLSGTWGASRAPGLQNLEFETPAADRGRDIELSVVQVGNEVRITETRVAGKQEKTESYVLVVGQQQNLDRFGRSQTVNVQWSGSSLVVEAFGKWRETWRIEGNLLKIERESLVNDGRSRTLTLSSRGGA